MNILLFSDSPIGGPPFLKNFSNINADLAQSSYTGRWHDLDFPRIINKVQAVQVNYNDKANSTPDLAQTGQVLYNNNQQVASSDGSVWLQPDPTGVMTNDSTGFASYFVTPTKDPSATDTGYFVVRGSDGYGALPANPDFHNLLTDWVSSNFDFAVNDQTDELYV